MYSGTSVGTKSQISCGQGRLPSSTRTDGGARNNLAKTARCHLIEFRTLRHCSTEQYRKSEKSKKLSPTARSVL